MAQTDCDSSTSAPADTIQSLFDCLEGTLLSYARRLLGEATLAEDLVQEAFLRLHTHFPQVREPRRWLFRTVHNLALNHHRAAARVVPLPNASHPLPDPDPGPDEALAHAEQLQHLHLCLEHLDPRSQNLIRLKFHDGLSYQQISHQTGLTCGHVGYLLHHAIKRLAAAMNQSEIPS